MKQIGLSDLNILDVGNKIQIAGALWQNEKTTYLVLLPGETIENTELVVLPMDVPEWERFVRQTDILETEILQHDSGGVIKQLVRKSQRQIDSRVQWSVFLRDGFRCRYCGARGIPLTVDHIVLWEEGGPTIIINLISCCKKCNRVRGNMQYEDWLKHPYYLEINGYLPEESRKQNEDVVSTIPHLRTLITQNRRSR